VDPGWLYLHFLDRELLTTCSLYGNLSPRRIQDDFPASSLPLPASLLGQGAVNLSGSSALLAPPPAPEEGEGTA
jgi:hypothetical protein